MSLDNLADNGQTQSHSPFFGREEWMKYYLYVVRMNPFAAVFDLNRQIPAIFNRININFYPPSFFHRFYGIEEDMKQYLFYFIFIQKSLPDVFRYTYVYFYLFALNSIVQDRFNFFKQMPEIYPGRRKDHRL